MLEDYEARVRAVDWDEYETAYGSGGPVANDLIALSRPDRKAALDATHHLWCSLCHQHAYVSSAAWPALPFLMEILDHSDDALTIELLDILLGFAVCTEQDEGIEWKKKIRTRLAMELPRFETLMTHQDETISSFAESIINSLQGTIVPHEPLWVFVKFTGNLTAHKQAESRVRETLTSLDTWYHGYLSPGMLLLPGQSTKFSLSIPKTLVESVIEALRHADLTKGSYIRRSDGQEICLS